MKSLPFFLTFAYLFFCASFIFAEQQDQIAFYDQATPYQITPEQISFWDTLARSLNDSYPPVDGRLWRLEAYLCNAQKEFADLSYQIKHEYAGTVAPISSGILSFFFPAYHPEPTAEIQDPFSQKLSENILTKYRQRFDDENAHLRPYQEKKGAQFWLGTPPFHGINVASMKPWSLKNAQQFRAPPPPNVPTFWQQQLEVIQEEMKSLDPQKLQKIFFWAGMPEKTDGDWLVIADQYMATHQTPIEIELKVRAKLATALQDANIAVFDSKYTYWIKRPNMLQEGFMTIITCPNHPSYPSGHSTLSAAAITILCRYFPESRERWEILAKEAGNSRIWAGIHFPIDDQAGQNLGHQIGETVLADEKI